MSFRCNECSATFIFQFELIIHRQEHKVILTKVDEDEDCICQLCNLKCFNLDHLKNHVNQHIENQKFICGSCNKEFVRETFYISHIKNYIHSHVDPKYVCVLCDKKLSSRRNLTDHVRLHTRETPHKCDVCNKLFVRGDKLAIHRKTHETNKENAPYETKKLFTCHYCRKQFTRKGNLQFHSRSHMAYLKYVCEYCGQQFLRCDHLKRHELHHNCDLITKQCLCVVCGQKFSKEQLKTHMTDQHNDGLYKCKECDKSFTNKAKLIFHERTHLMKSKTFRI